MRSTRLIKGAQAGFTMIELVVVIVILGILAATALPKFIDLSGDAKKASVAGVYGGFNAAVATVRAKWMVNGANPGTCPGAVPTSCTAGTVISIDGVNVGFNALGFPSSNAAPALTAGVQTVSEDDCVNVWQAILGGTGPSITKTAADKKEWVATVSSPTCTYTYYGGSATAAVPGRSFTYDTSTGAMALTNP